jgi:tight adherence protein B
MYALLYQITISLLMFAAVFLFVQYGWTTTRVWFTRMEWWYDRVLVQQLLLQVNPRMAVGLSILGVVLVGLMTYQVMGHYPWFFIGTAAGALLPSLVVRHLAQKRVERLESQLVDGITTLASGVRAGLNLVQSMELLARTAAPPISQEFAQLLREYAMGLDLNQAMRNTANRIALSNYRLLFTALEMHRTRGGDSGESLDRIAESVREVQRLQGKLDALTSQGRTQAWMMAVTPAFFAVVLYTIDPQGVSRMFSETLGRVLLLISAGLVVVAFLWIRRIMAIDI